MDPQEKNIPSSSIGINTNKATDLDKKKKSTPVESNNLQKAEERDRKSSIPPLPLNNNNNDNDTDKNNNDTDNSKDEDFNTSNIASTISNTILNQLGQKVTQISEAVKPHLRDLDLIQQTTWQTLLMGAVQTSNQDLRTKALSNIVDRDQREIVEFFLMLHDQQNHKILKKDEKINQLEQRMNKLELLVQSYQTKSDQLK